MAEISASRHEVVAAMENRRFFPRFAGLLSGFLLLVLAPVTVAETPGKLADHLPGYSVARCLFPEGRLVLEREGELLVLRKGDTLPEMPRMKVLELDAEGALLGEAAAAGAAVTTSAVPERMIKITQTPEGVIDVTLMTAQPPENEEVELLEAGTVLAIGPDGEPIAEPMGGASAAGAPATGVPAAGVPAIRPTRAPIAEPDPGTEDQDGQP
ncbi:MAG: hypothetical protein GY719_35640 [bacterium]|nr:hypothetical protein [bacterium]